MKGYRIYPATYQSRPSIDNKRQLLFNLILHRLYNQSWYQPAHSYHGRPVSSLWFEASDDEPCTSERTSFIRGFPGSGLSLTCQTYQPLHSTPNAAWPFRSTSTNKLCSRIIGPFTTRSHFRTFETQRFQVDVVRCLYQICNTRRLLLTGRTIKIQAASTQWDLCY